MGRKWGEESRDDRRHGREDRNGRRFGGRGGGRGDVAGCTTLYVKGFPDNVSEREMRNLCRLFEGYECCRVNDNYGRGPNVFIKFQDVEAAERALEALDGYDFDEEDPQCALVAEFARREMEVPRNAEWEAEPEQRFDDRERDRGYRDGGNRRDGGGYRNSYRDSDESAHRGRARRDSSRNYGRGDDRGPQYEDAPWCHKRSRSRSRDRERKHGTAKTATYDREGSGAEKGSGPRQSDVHSDQQGIDTVACKIDNRDEQELREYFEGARGYQGIKFNRKVNMCFIKFDCPEAALDALSECEGQLTASLARRNLDLF